MGEDGGVGAADERRAVADPAARPARVLFWGTPEFAVPALRALAGAGHEVVGAVTRPDRPAGRGRAVRASAVKVEAAARGIPVLQPERPAGEEFERRLRELAPDVSIVAAYGHILRDEILVLPPFGSLNIHASLLPKLRGAAPVNWAIIRGCERSGVTVMRMVREMDAGPVLYQIPVPIGPRMTAGELYERTARLGAEAIVETLARLREDRLVEREQDHARATYAPKLDRPAARVVWGRPADEVSRWIRGCDPWPGAWTELDGLSVQLFSSVPEEGREGGGEPPGQVVKTDSRRGLLVAAGRGGVWVEEVKPAGRRRMESIAWVRGRGVSVGARFE
ncbi:MAG: methionyl-tRNA formyltransferase [Gemmatimonadota bacterium]